MSAIALTPGMRRAVPIWLIVLLALAVHAPLLLMQLPANSYDANFHMFFASHYADHWFDPWNEKWYGGFSQTTYLPLPQQWIALLSHFLGLKMAYMTVQLIAVLLLPIGVYRYARLWTKDDRAASYAAVGSVFLGSLAMLVYQAGQLSTTVAIPLYLNAIPYFYEWTRQADRRAFLKGMALTFAAAATHHVTLIFGSVLFVLPVIWLAFSETKEERHGHGLTGLMPVLTRAAAFAGVAIVGALIIAAPYFIALRQNPIDQLPIPHASRSNLLLNWDFGINYFVVPYGALLLALPFVALKGSAEKRLRPLLLGFWLTMLLGLGGTTPIPRVLLGRAFEVLTFERFTFWATLMMLPILGLIIVKLVDRWRWKAVAPLWLCAVLTFGFSLGWTTLGRTAAENNIDIRPVVDFLKRDGHDQYRFLALGFGFTVSAITTETNAKTVDGEYNSARTLPEMTKYGSAQLSNSKYYGIAGMESLRAMLKHADKYGIKWIFIRDRYYEPIVQFGGWRKVDSFSGGMTSLWMKDSVPLAQPIATNIVPPRWHGLHWGTIPIATSIFAIFVILLVRDRRPVPRMVEFPARAPEPVPALQEVRR